MSSSSRKTKTFNQEKSSLPDHNRFTSPMSAFRRKKKTSGTGNNDPGKSFTSSFFFIIINKYLGFPFKIEHAHLPQLLHFTDEVPARFTNPSASSSSSSTSGTAAVTAMTNPPNESMATLTTSIANNGSIVIGALQPSAMIPTDHPPPLIHSSGSAAAAMNKSLDAKK